MGECVALIMLKYTLIHACYYYEFMIELIFYVSNYMLCMLT